MSEQKRQSYLQGAFILAIGTIIVKIIGVFFKMPLSNLLGGVGGGYFTAAYTIFNIIYALAVAGLPVAISKMVSENIVLGRYKDARKVLKVSIMLFTITASVCFIIMFFGAGKFSQLIGMKGAEKAIMALAPAIIFTCIMSAFRGYYQGLQNMYPTAVSQVIEAISKLIFGILFAYLMQTYALEAYDKTSKVFGVLIEQRADALIAIAQWSAAAAILGVTVSTLMGMIYLFIRHLFIGDKITKQQLKCSPKAKSTKITMYKMLAIAIPVCLGAIALNLTNLIDTASIMNRLDVAMNVDTGKIYDMYSGLIPSDMPKQGLTSYLYGSYSMFAVSIFNLVPALTTTIGISALPAVASAWARKDKHLVKRNVESILRVTAMFAIPAGLGISFMADPITKLLYFAKPMEAQIASMLLKSLGIASIFVSFTAPLNSMLQAIGRVSVPVKLLVMGGAIKLTINYIFVAIPSFNIKAAPIGTLLCYLSIVVLSIYILRKNIKIKINYSRIFIKPIFCGFLCAISAGVSYNLISRFWHSNLLTLVSIGFGGLIYIISMILVKGIVKDDVLMLPKGEKIAKVLEKYSIIG